MNKLAVLLGIACFAACLSAIESVSVTYADCGSTATNIQADILPCAVKASGACELQRNEETTFTIKFTPASDVATVNHTVYGSIFGRDVAFREVNGSACTNIVPDQCPVTAGVEHTYSKSFHIRGSYPLIPVTVKYILTGPNNETILCIKVNTKIADKNVRRGGGRRSRPTRRPT